MKQFMEDSKPIYQQIAEGLEDEILRKDLKEGARKIIQEKRRQMFYQEYILPLWEEAGKLNLDKDTVMDMMKKARKETK